MIYEEFRRAPTAEASRLGLLCATYDPITFGRLERLHVPVGGRCVDLGAGTGTVARHLAGRVGPGGLVTAVDIVDYDEARDECGVGEVTSPWSQVELVRADITRDVLPPGPYDVAYVRAVLHFLPQREAIIERLTKELRPGGVLAIETFDFGTAAADPAPAGPAWRLMLDLAGTADIPLEWAVELTEILQDLDLGVVLAESTSILAPVGSPGRSYWAASLELARPFLRSEPGGGPMVDAAVDHLRTYPGVVRLPALSSVYGQAPDDEPAHELMPRRR